MNLKIRLLVAVIAFAAAGVYVTFFSEPAREKMVAKLHSATTNEVVSCLGKPFKIVDATTFTSRANERAEQGVPVSNADMAAKGMVWLYPDGGIRNADVHNYQTIFFDGSNRVYQVYRTYWVKDPWGARL